MGIIRVMQLNVSAAPSMEPPLCIIRKARNMSDQLKALIISLILIACALFGVYFSMIHTLNSAVVTAREQVINDGDTTTTEESVEVVKVDVVRYPVFRRMYYTELKNMETGESTVYTDAYKYSQFLPYESQMVKVECTRYYIDGYENRLLTEFVIEEE